MRWFTTVMILAPLLVGGSTPPTAPSPSKPEECPFAFDPNLVVGRLLACVRVEVGQPMIHTRTWHDPDGDPATVSILHGPEGARIVNRTRAGSYTILWTPRQIQTCAIVVQVTDQPARGKPKSDVGTIVVQVVPHGSRSAPHGCGGPPQ
jgi:hypothetical protein